MSSTSVGVTTWKCAWSFEDGGLATTMSQFEARPTEIRSGNGVAGVFTTASTRAPRIRPSMPAPIGRLCAVADVGAEPQPPPVAPLVPGVLLLLHHDRLAEEERMREPLDEALPLHGLLDAAPVADALLSHHPPRSFRPSRRQVVPFQKLAQVVASEAGLLRGSGDVSVVPGEERLQVRRLEGVDDALLGLLEVEADGERAGIECGSAPRRRPWVTRPRPRRPARRRRRAPWRRGRSGRARPGRSVAAAREMTGPDDSEAARSTTLRSSRIRCLGNGWANSIPARRAHPGRRCQAQVAAARDLLRRKWLREVGDVLVDARAGARHLDVDDADAEVEIAFAGTCPLLTIARRSRFVAARTHESTLTVADRRRRA